MARALFAQLRQRIDTLTTLSCYLCRTVFALAVTCLHSLQGCYWPTLSCICRARREREIGGLFVRDIYSRLRTTLLNLLSVRLTRKV